MTVAAIVLVAISALMHGGWNLLGKREQPATAFFLVAAIIGVLSLSPLALYYAALFPRLPGSLWLLALASGGAEAAYMAALAAAYRHGHISIVYPIARSSPLIVVTATTLLLGHKEQVSASCIAGILLIVAGCTILPMQCFREFRAANYLNRGSLFALTAAFGTAAYSIIDDKALHLLREHPALRLSPLHAGLFYTVLIAWATALGLALGVLTANRASGIREVLQRGWRPAALTGIMIRLTYILVLIAMAFARDVSYIVAFRQMSVPIGALLGILLLKEPAHRPKLAGIAIITAGLLLVALP